MKARVIVLAVSTAVVIAVLAGIVIQKERLLARGDRVFMKLAPVDPRSLIQGDYMALRYALSIDLAGKLVTQKGVPWRRSGLAAIEVDADGIATKVRPWSEGDTLAPGERLLRYKNVDGQIRFGAESFFFQEGRASAFEKAAYGELAVDGSGSSVLVGLRDAELKMLE